MEDFNSWTLEHTVGELLRENHLTIACAESCTGGLLTSRLTDIAGSSEYVKGSVVCYTNEIKQKFTGVSDELLSENPDAVSQKIALQLAKGIRENIGTDLGVGITGIAGPGGGTSEKPVGLVYIAVSGSKGSVVTKNIFSGTRTEIKFAATTKALQMIKEYI